MKLPTFTLLDNKIATEKEPLPDMVGKILVSAGSIKSRQMGLVIKTGPGISENGSLVPTGVTPGDIILYSNYAGTDVSFEGNDYLIITGTSAIMFVVGHVDLDAFDFNDRWEEVWKVAGAYAAKSEIDDQEFNAQIPPRQLVHI